MKTLWSAYALFGASKKSLKIPKGGNQNPYIEKEQTTQWLKENKQTDKQRSKFTPDLPFFDLRILITPLISLNSSYAENIHPKIRNRLLAHLCKVSLIFKSMC
jgi:hypothetical protein